MDYIASSELKTILHSKRANLYYLEHCRVVVNGGRVEYITDQGKKSLYWNIPIANTTSILLGTGTSISQAAMREFAKAGVLIGFCGGGGSPLFTSTDVECDVHWLTSQSEYRPTKYLQQWVSFWFDDFKRLQAAKRFQILRLKNIQKHWSRLQHEAPPLGILANALDEGIQQAFEEVANCISTEALFLWEATFTKKLYRLLCHCSGYGKFTRAKQGTGTDPANRFLDHGNYLAYGMAATATWVLGLPHGLSVMHGKTRRGGLVFDVADVVKDALVLPTAFLGALEGDEEQAFRIRCLEILRRHNALDLMIDALKDVIDGNSGESP
jgi:CRISP-associated protein Cas1